MNTGIQQVILGHFEMRLATTEQFRETFRHALIHLLKSLLETIAGFAIDFANCAFERIKRRNQVLVLRIQVLAALGLLAKLIDGSEIDRAQSLSIPLVQCFQPLRPQG